MWKSVRQNAAIIETKQGQGHGDRVSRQREHVEPTREQTNRKRRLVSLRAVRDQARLLYPSEIFPLRWPRLIARVLAKQKWDTKSGER